MGALYRGDISAKSLAPAATKEEICDDFREDWLRDMHYDGEGKKQGNGKDLATPDLKWTF
jgi:hypothetical protein